MLAVFASQRVEQRVRLLLTAVVDVVQLLEPLLAQRQRRVGSGLNGVEHTRVHVRLEREDRVDPLLLAHDDAHAPAGHRVAFRQRVHLQRHVLRALGLHDRDRVFGVADETVRVVVHDQDVVPGSEVDDLLEQLHRGGLSRRHVGVVDEHHLHTVQPGLFDGVEVGVEVGLLVQRIGEHFAARQTHGRRVGGVAGVRDEDFVALIEERHADVHDTLLRADQRQHLRLEVQLGAVPFLVPVGKSLAQDGFTLIRHVLMYVGTLRLFRQAVDHGLVGRQVGAAHGQFYDLAAGGRFDLGDLAQTARKIVLSDAVQPVRTGDVDCFCHSLNMFGIMLSGQR